MKRKIIYCTIMYIVTYILIVGISVQDYNIFSTVVRNQTTETVRYTIIPWLWVPRLINWVPVLLACCMVYTVIKNVVVSESSLFAGISICKMLIRLFPQADKMTIIIYLHIASVVVYFLQYVGSYVILHIYLHQRRRFMHIFQRKRGRRLYVRICLVTIRMQI